MLYDKNNIFFKIIQKEVPCDLVYEDKHVLSFKDINPKVPIHVLVIPKGLYVSFDDFMSNGSTEEIISFFKIVKKITKTLLINETGYRLIINNGRDGGQEVPHFHVHILGGKKIGDLVSRI